MPNANTLDASLSFPRFLGDSETPYPAPPDALQWINVQHYQAAMERHLTDALQGQAQPWVALGQAMRTLQDWHERSRELIATAMLTLPRSIGHLYLPYRQACLNGLVAEARVQQALGSLPQEAFETINECAQALLSDAEPRQAYRLWSFVLRGPDEQATWPGAFALSTLPELPDAPSPAFLLYRFGEDGGWTSHPSMPALERLLADLLGAQSPFSVSSQEARWPRLIDLMDLALVTLTEAASDSSMDSPEARERLTLEALRTLSVPINPARALAFASIDETWRSLRLSEAARPWMARLSGPVLARLTQLLVQYAEAFVASERLLRRAIPVRDAYVAARVHGYLSTQFALTQPCRVRLDLPLSVQWVREPVVGSGAPGMPVRRVARPSAERQWLTLEALALAQVDDSMADRLQFLKVDISPSDHPQHALLTTGIDAGWVRRMAEHLDVAGNYERLMADAYLRAGRFEANADQDTATLLAPYDLALQLHGVVAQALGRLEPSGVRMADRARQATHSQAWVADGLDLTVRPAALKVFDEKTHSSGSILAGVSFIEDRASGTTLLYLPDAPDGHGFSQYPDLATAVEAVEWLLLDDRLRGYLCERALEGNVEYLDSLIRQGLAKGFRHFIEARDPWPAHLSLTHVQYLADWGLRMRDHRASSTSNADKVFEAAQDSRNDVLRYIRMALGFVPFVGSVLAMVDALEAGIVAGQAFAQGESIAGVEAVESVLVSLVDAMMDFGPGALAASHSSLMVTARARQLRQAPRGYGRFRELCSWSHRRVEEAFKGYERPVILRGAPGTEGRWRNVHQEAEGTFITRGSYVYAVEWDSSLNTWRLSPTQTRHYRQPVALDEAGNWQTHGHLYGALVDGGLRGGGAVQSYLADRLDPLWPDALRRLLPRWWTDAHYRRQQQLASEAHSRLRTLVSHDDVLEQRLNDYRAQGPEAPAGPAIEACDRVIEAVSLYYDTLERYRPLLQGRRQGEIRSDQSRAAATLAARTNLQIRLAFLESDRLSELAQAQRREIQETILQRYREQGPLTPVGPDLIERQRAIRQTIAQILAQYDLIQHGLDRLTQWQRRITLAEHRRRLHTGNEASFQAFDTAATTLARIGLLLDLAPHDNLDDPSWLYMRRLYTLARVRFDRVAQASYHGGRLNLPLPQRERLKIQLRENSQALIRVIRRLLASYPEQFDADYAERLLNELGRLRDGLGHRPVAEARPHRPQARVFEGDGLLLVGEPVRGQPSVLTVSNVNNRTERWLRRVDNTYEPAETAAEAPPVLPPVEIARITQYRLDHLPVFRNRMQRYARQQMLPADLEDLFLGESQELEFRADQLAQSSQSQRYAALVRQSREQAAQLRAEGRQARIDTCKASTRPTSAQLQYLAEQGEVRIRKLGGRQRSGTASRSNWLQEYEVLDSRSGRPLSYAHFHYRQEQSAFEEFIVAHLKTPGQRRLGATAPGQAPIWRGEISRPLAERLFSTALG
ncbi:hypothetical protein [Pseudomonas sp. DC3000-4b1]|uniref:hypothetical protein n=1 Tax=unclassified Pseudomonas TaxID=196821 RepID=UPI003CE8624C